MLLILLRSLDNIALFVIRQLADHIHFMKGDFSDEKECKIFDGRIFGNGHVVRVEWMRQH